MGPRVCGLAAGEAEIPANSLLGNFIEAGLGGASTAAKKGFKPEPYEPIPYASEQGIFGGLAGNSKWRTGKFLRRAGRSALAPIY
jgi:hypothetical protein